MKFGVPNSRILRPRPKITLGLVAAFVASAVLWAVILAPVWQWLMR